MAHKKALIGHAKWKFDTNDSTTSAIGSATMQSNFNLPINAQVLGAWTDVKTNMTSGGSATVALAVGGVTIKSATAFNNSAYQGLDFHLARTAVALTTSAGELTFTIADAALTAGEVDIYVEYILAD